MNKKVALFISIPKCASKSIQKTLELGIGRDNELHATKEEHVISENHQRLKVLEVKYNINELFSFCFVRNPYDRIISWYKYYKSHPSYNKITLNEWVALGCPIHWESQNKTNWKKEKLNPLLQFNFIDSNRGNNVDFIGRMENYDDDIEKLRKILNDIFKEKGFEKFIPFTKVHINKTYKGEELTVESKEIIYNLFKKDFEYFDYKK